MQEVNLMKYCYRCMKENKEEGKCTFCGYDGSQTPTPHILPPGTLIMDRYLIGLPIGQGGFGITYIGRDTRLDMRVAIKEYYPNGFITRNTEISNDIVITTGNNDQFVKKGLERFLDEAKTLASFNDFPGVVDVRDFFELNGTAYIVMEYLEGEDLRRKIEKGLFSSDEIFAKMIPVMDALSEIHKCQIIHRDISPDNIMVLGNGTFKLMDFGASRSVEMGEAATMTVMLKRGYAPIEQYYAKGNFGTWTDVYALCATIYKAITGVTPPEALERQIDDQIKWPSELGYQITPLQEAVLKKGMAVNYVNRFKNIEELKNALFSANSDSTVLIETSDSFTHASDRNKVRSVIKKVNPMLFIISILMIILIVLGILLLIDRKPGNEVISEATNTVEDVDISESVDVSISEEKVEDIEVSSVSEEVSEEINEIEDEISKEDTETVYKGLIHPFETTANYCSDDGIIHLSGQVLGISGQSACSTIFMWGFKDIPTEEDILDTWEKANLKENTTFSGNGAYLVGELSSEKLDQYIVIVTYNKEFELLCYSIEKIVFIEGNGPFIDDMYEKLQTDVIEEHVDSSEVVQHPVEIKDVYIDSNGGVVLEGKVQGFEGKSVQTGIFGWGMYKPVGEQIIEDWNNSDLKDNTGDFWGCEGDFCMGFQPDINMSYVSLVSFNKYKEIVGYSIVKLTFEDDNLPVVEDLY